MVTEDFPAGLDVTKHQLSVILTGISRILETEDFGKTAGNLFDLINGLIGAKSGYVALLSSDDAENEVLFLDAGGMHCTATPDLPMPVRGLRAEAYTTGSVACDNDFSSSRWQELLPPGHLRLNNVLFAPLVIENKTVGVLGLANKDGGFTEQDKRLAFAFGQLAAVALTRSRAMAALKESEAVTKTLLNKAPIPTIVLNPDTSIRYVNAAFEKITGYAAAEIIGLKPPFPWWTDKSSKASGLLVDIFQTGTTCTELECTNKAGETFRLEATDTLVTVENRTVLLISTAVDITERGLAEKRSRRYAERLRLLREIDREIVAATSPEAVAQTVLSHICRLVPCRRASVTLLNQEKNEMILFAANLKNDEAGAVHDRIHLYQPWIDELANGKNIMVPDIQLLAEPFASITAFLEAQGIRSVLSCPLFFQGGLIGALNLGEDKVYSYSAEEEEIAADVAHQLSIAIGQARLNEQIKQQRDDLDKRVRERTAELEEKNSDLARLNKLFMGREFRIKELKEKIAALEERRN